MFDNTKLALIVDLKGKVSRILSTKAAILREEEKMGLETTYAAIDALILSNKDHEDLLTFHDELLISLSLLGSTRKGVIKKHIIPIIMDIVDQKWGENE